MLWMCLYGITTLTCILACSRMCPRGSRTMFIALSGISLVFLAQRRISEGALDLSPKTELGRESAGVLIIAAWSLQNLVLSNTPTSQMLAYAIVGVSVAAIASVALIPKFYLSQKDAIDHCFGVGIGPVTAHLFRSDWSQNKLSITAVVASNRAKQQLRLSGFLSTME
eukprot:CRZ01526.1 hypothetical protein [Spongospora subterranea]